MGTSDMPWAARRRRLLSVPRGPREWGRLLYEPDWCRRWPIENFQTVVMPLFVFALLFLFLDNVLSGDVIPGREGWALFMGALLVGATVLSVYLVLLTFRVMPFRIYEAGITRERVPLMDGLLRRGALIPSERIERVRVKSSPSDRAWSRWIAIEYREEDGTLGSTVASGSDPLSVLLALFRIAPDKLDEGARELADPDNLPEAPAPAGDAEADGLVVRVAMIYFLLIIASFPLALLLQVIHLKGLSHVRYIPDVIGVVVFVSATVAGMAGWSALSSYGSIWQSRRADLGDEGLRARLPFMLRVLLKAPPLLPFDRVLRARRCLDRRSLGPRYQMLVREGEPIPITPVLYKGLAERPEFERRGFELVNRSPETDGSGGLATLNLPVFLGIMAALVVVIFAVLTVVDPLSEDNGVEEDQSDTPPEPTIMHYIVIFVVFPLAMLWAFAMFYQGRRHRAIERATVGMEVGGGSIRLPSGRAPVDEVPRSDIESISAVRFWPSNRYVLRVRTKEHTLHLPLHALDDLRSNGFDVELPEKLEKKM